MTEDWGTNTGWLVLTLFACYFTAREVIEFLGLTGWVAFVIGVLLIGAPIFIGSMLLYYRIFLDDEPTQVPSEST